MAATANWTKKTKNVYNSVNYLNIKLKPGEVVVTKLSLTSEDFLHLHLQRLGTRSV